MRFYVVFQKSSIFREDLLFCYKLSTTKLRRDCSIQLDEIHQQESCNTPLPKVDYLDDSPASENLTDDMLRDWEDSP